MKIAFTGHRPNKLGGYDDSRNLASAFYTVVGHILDTLRPMAIISGMALGVDTWAAKLALMHGIALHAYVPFKGQEKMWPPNSQEQYRILLDSAGSVVYCSPPGYSSSKMQVRNERMIDDCDVLIAIWGGTPGGTKNCLEYATKKNVKILRFTPNHLRYGAVTA
jgi:uncharacterized phage-like protein YoqJ